MLRRRARDSARGVRNIPHKHSEDRIHTVLSGVFYTGLGEEFDESRFGYICSSRPGNSLMGGANLVNREEIENRHAFDYLREIAHPTLVVNGSNDVII